jgi:hypothetical protein
VRNAVPFEKQTKLMAAGRGVLTDDFQQLHTRAVRAGPVREKLADDM